MAQGIKTVFGGAQIGPERTFANEEAVNELLDVLEAGGVKEIDSAQLYAGSEELLGKTNAGSRFTIQTKVPGVMVPGSLKKDELLRSVEESLKKLHIDKVDILYIHSPDPSIPIAETLEGIQAAYKAGYFARFGLSNFLAEGVQAIYDHSKRNGYVLPTVYQGNYSAVSRKPETMLFPTLRKLGMSFYAYSPLAGGFLTKTKQQITEGGPGAGRFDPSTWVGQLYLKLFNKPSYLEALARWEAIAKDAGCSRADLANRWVKYNSALTREHGDAIIIGARNPDQLKETLKGMDAGPLSEDVAKRIDDVWKSVEHEASLDAVNG